MSRSKKYILETEAMLDRLRNLLYRHDAGTNPSAYAKDAESLRRISMTLHRWHELECGDSNGYASFCIARGHTKNGAFEYDDTGGAYVERHDHDKVGATYAKIPDRESGARKRLAKILANYPTLTAYVQTDPRGCALYILKPGDVPEGADVSSCYSRGLAVFQ